LFFLFSLIEGLSCLLNVYLGCASLYFLMRLKYFLKIKNKKPLSLFLFLFPVPKLPLPQCFGQVYKFINDAFTLPCISYMATTLVFLLLSLKKKKSSGLHLKEVGW
jgi:hypothetical protein